MVSTYKACIKTLLYTIQTQVITLVYIYIEPKPSCNLYTQTQCITFVCAHANPKLNCSLCTETLKPNTHSYTPVPPMRAHAQFCLCTLVMVNWASVLAVIRSSVTDLL